MDRNDRRSIEARFAVVLIAAATIAWNVPAAGAQIAIGGTGAVQSVIPVLARAFAVDRPGVAFNFPPSLGSSGGLRALIAGKLDIAVSSRPLKDSEKTAGVTATPVFRSPFVLVTSRTGPQPGLSRRQLIDIYHLRMTEWPDGAALRPILRPRSDTDTALLRRMLDNPSDSVGHAFSVKTIPVGRTDQENLDLAEKTPGSLATATLITVIGERRRVTPLAIDGVAPTVENLAAGAYPYEKTLLLAVMADTSQVARDFVAFVAGPAGAAIAAKYGALPPAAR